jgi:2,5-furandicarboxylate decarboxylase 1
MSSRKVRYGEYVGYYGVVKRNPVLHVTAITHREDALFQTADHRRPLRWRAPTPRNSPPMKTESAAWAALMASVREPLAVYATPSSGGMYNVRVSLRQRVPGDARTPSPRSSARTPKPSTFSPSIPTSTCSPTRKPIGRWRRAFRPTAISSSARAFRVVPLDPSLGGARTGAKLGFDCTIPFGKGELVRILGADAAGAKKGTLRTNRPSEALAPDPRAFWELMAALGSKDGREIVRELDALYAAKRLGRLDDGRYVLKSNGK